MSRRLVQTGIMLAIGLPLGAQQTIEASSSDMWPGARRAAARMSSTVSMSPAVEAAVARGLGWLAADQNDNGFWLGLVGKRRRESYLENAPIDIQVREGTGHLGVTALCGMAFLAGGNAPNRGQYGRAVEKSVAAVLSCVHENGVIATAGTLMYSHAFATLFLAEVYGMGVDSKVRAGLERATQIIVDSQNAQGGWRYTPFTPSTDLSVTVCQLQALRAARNIGIKIPRDTIDRAVDYVKRSQVQRGPDRGRYYYDLDATWRLPKTDHYAIQAAAATSLLSAGIYDRELIEPVLDFLDDEMPVITAHWPNHYYFWYGNYYACQVFFYADATLRKGCFAPYYASMCDHLLVDQEDDGRWRNPQSEGPGDPFATAVACIILQIPNQYLPIFQR